MSALAGEAARPPAGAAGTIGGLGFGWTIRGPRGFRLGRARFARRCGWRPRRSLAGEERRRFTHGGASPRVLGRRGRIRGRGLGCRLGTLRLGTLRFDPLRLDACFDPLRLEALRLDARFEPLPLGSRGPVEIGNRGVELGLDRRPRLEDFGFSRLALAMSLIHI
jgi:hypothetical protein